MRRYSVQGYGFFLLLKIWAKIFLKIKLKTRVLNTVRNFLIIPNNPLEMNLKLYQKKQFKKQQKQLVT